MPKFGEAFGVSLTEIEEDLLDRTEPRNIRPADLWKEYYAEFARGDVRGISTSTFGVAIRHGTSGTPSDSAPNKEPLPENLVARLSHESPYVVSFRVLQEWDGYVTEVGADYFRARLTDLSSNQSQDSEEAMIPLDELDEESRARISVGSMFRWSIGYERLRSGQKNRVSRMVMRRLPAWTREELERAKLEAEKLSRSITWE